MAGDRRAGRWMCECVWGGGERGDWKSGRVNNWVTGEWLWRQAVPSVVVFPKWPDGEPYPPPTPQPSTQVGGVGGGCFHVTRLTWFTCMCVHVCACVSIHSVHGSSGTWRWYMCAIRRLDEPCRKGLGLMVFYI